MHRARWDSDYAQTYRFRNQSRFHSERSHARTHFSDFVAATRRPIAQDKSIDLIEVTKARGSRYPHNSTAGHALETCLKPRRIPRRRLLSFRVGCGRIREQEEKSRREWSRERSMFLFSLRLERDPTLIRIGLRQACLHARSINLVYIKAIVPHWNCAEGTILYAVYPLE